MSEVQLAEARAFYGFQIAMENIRRRVTCQKPCAGHMSKTLRWSHVKNPARVTYQKPCAGHMSKSREADRAE
jgi:hypothetical protein